MASLLDKVNTLIRANLHSLVDRALQQNSVAVLDEYIRQAENNLNALEDAVATVGGNVRTLKRKFEEYTVASQQLDRDIDTLLAKGQDTLASAAQSDLNSKQRLADEYKAQYDQQAGEHQKLMDARLKLEAKLTTIKQEREHLLALLELAKSKEVSLRAIKSLDDLAGIGDSDVARVGDQIRARLDQASARMEMATTRLDQQMDEILEQDKIDNQLAERKRRLGLS
jgi:phage shock protein A